MEDIGVNESFGMKLHGEESAKEATTHGQNGRGTIEEENIVLLRVEGRRRRARKTDT